MSALRSTKDLKGIIEKARKVNFSNTFQENSESKIQEVQSSSDDEMSYDMRFEKKGQASFGTSRSTKDTEENQKFQKQIALSKNDAAVIEQQQKKICMLNLEMDELQKKYDKLKRAYDKVAEEARIEREEYATVRETQLE